jgi:hypothetical protein
MFRRFFLMLIVLMLIGCQSATSTGTTPSPTSTSSATKTRILQPTFTETPTHSPAVPASTVELDGAEVPQGFSLTKFADLSHPIAFTFDA